MTDTRSNVILLADDNEEDRFLMQGALQDSSLNNRLDCVSSEDQLLAYLKRSGRYTYLSNIPLPGLIIVELNLQNGLGNQILKKIKLMPEFKSIPIVAMSITETAQEINESYNNGANSFIKKPESFDKLIETLKILNEYWFKTVTTSKEGQLIS